MAGPATPKRIEIYVDEDGNKPYITWLESLRNPETELRIIRRVDRLRSGNRGDCKPVGAGVYELRLFFGSGYRVYFGEAGQTLVVLLVGGDKSSQRRDIERAKGYWADFKQRQP